LIGIGKKAPDGNKLPIRDISGYTIPFDVICTDADKTPKLCINAN